MRISQSVSLISLVAILLDAPGTSTLKAQSAFSSTDGEPEVRQALPANAPFSSPTPIPVMKALPVGTPVSDPSVNSFTTPPTPPPSSVVVPSATPASTPFAPYQSSVPPSDPDGSIRFAPSTSADPAALAAAQLQMADGFYTRKQTEEAVPEYEKFLIMSSKDSPGREGALYHLAECQRLMGSMTAAESTLQRLIGENPSSQYKAAAEFRLGEINETNGNLLAASDHFAQSASNAKDDSIVQTAHFREALCLEQSGRKDQAQALFEILAKTPATNPYRIPSLLHLANAAQEAGNKEAALSWYDQVLSSKATGEILAEAAVKSALIQSDLGKNAEARTLFEKVAVSKDAGGWQSVAALGALRLASQSGDETAVLKVADIALTGNTDNRPEILLSQANALRKLGKNAQALQIYEAIMRDYPGSKTASLALFQRLLVLHATHAESLIGEIDRYLLATSDPSDRARAQLLKAEESLRLGKYKEAADLYHQLDTSALPPSSKTEILYKEAWALTQTADQAAAIAALTQFLEAYPKDERAATALAQRGLLKQQTKDISGALADFSQLEKEYPKAPERELAIHQKALLLGQRQDNKGMVDAFTLLLHDYPKSSAAPQAHYWLGWAAMENKDYATSVTEFSKARLGDPKQFGQRAGIRLLLADYYLNQPEDAAREAAALPPSMIPPEVGRWLGMKAMEAGNPAKAEKFLIPLIAQGLPGASDAEIQGTLASALIAQGKYKEAQLPSSICLRLAHDPASRAQALLVAASIQRSMKNLPQASSMIDEAMLLQPEGPINAQARILSGDLLSAQQDYTGAAKAYITVAVLSDDPVQTPRALIKAIDAYRHAGNITEADKTIAELQKRFPNIPVPPKSKQ